MLRRRLLLHHLLHHLLPFYLPLPLSFTLPLRRARSLSLPPSLHGTYDVLRSTEWNWRKRARVGQGSSPFLSRCRERRPVILAKETWYTRKRDLRDQAAHHFCPALVLSPRMCSLPRLEFLRSSFLSRSSALSVFLSLCLSVSVSLSPHAHRRRTSLRASRAQTHGIGLRDWFKGLVQGIGLKKM